MTSSFRESARNVPIVRTCDVIVCGGGPAGVAAAVAAARTGAEVQLIEMEGCLGGIWTAGLVSWVIDSANKPGIMREIGRRLNQRGARHGQGRDYAYDPEVMKLLLEEMCREAGVRVRLHTRIVAAGVSPGGRLETAITESVSGREAWRAEVFIDATGNGDLAARAGCRYKVGREENGEQQPASLLCLIAGIDPSEVDPFVCWADRPHHDAKSNLLAEMRRAGLSPSYSAPTLMHLGETLWVLSSNHQYGVSGLDSDHLSAATIEARAELHHLVGGLRGLGGPWRNARLVATGSHIGVRDGRRVRGLYRVGSDDVLRGVTHEDAVCRVMVGIDVHSPNPDMAKSYTHENRLRTQPYDIPLRALIASDVRGLVLAGRCISGDFVAHSSYRMTATAASTGQAAGAVAALAAQRGRLPEKVPWADVRESLLRLTGNEPLV